jgi:hypothetical protein
MYHLRHWLDPRSISRRAHLPSGYDVACDPDIVKRKAEVSHEKGILSVVLERLEVDLVFKDTERARVPCAQGTRGTGRQGVGGT